MNYHLYALSFKKYALVLIYSFAIMAMIAWSLEVYFQSLYGDLTRVGRFPERYFGWTLERQAIDEGLLKDYPLNEADVLVIGDSFSEPRVWQTRFIAAGFKVATIHWHDLNKIPKDASSTGTLSENIGEVLRQHGFKGHYVIIESIERLLQFRMKHLNKEGKELNRVNFVVDKQSLNYPITRRELFSFDKLNGVDWNLDALIHTFKLFVIQPERYTIRNSQAIKFSGCTLFSHALCHYVLFIYDDFLKETFNTIDKVLLVNKSLTDADILPIWVIIPDKSTVYLGYGKYNEHPYANVWQIFAQHNIIAPDLASQFIEKSRMTKDFYMPNDAHLSTDGYLYLGDVIFSEFTKLNTSQTNKLEN